jgi:hypothetical protein
MKFLQMPNLFVVTIDDRGAYTKPLNLTGHFPLQLANELMEFICNET